MPKVGHTTVYDYKNRITDLEGEVTTLKRRLDELRRAKVQAFYKQPVAVRRSSKPDVHAVEQVNQPNVAVLEQRITRLQNELELAELKYVRDVKELKETIQKLQDEMGSEKENHLVALNEMRNKHNHDLEVLRRGHTEELALYSERTEQERSAKVEAERELAEYKLRMRCVTLQLPDVGVLKTELTRLQEAYFALKQQHEQEVNKLEERIAELLADIAAHNEKSKRRFQLIPDRTYIVKKSTPTASSTSIGSVSDRNSQVDSHFSKPASIRPKSAVKKPVESNTEQSVVTRSPKPDTPSAATSKCPTYNSRVETIDRPKSTTTIRPKSSFARKPNLPAPPDKKTRPKSCWSDQRATPGAEKRSGSCGAALNRPRYGNVTSKIDTGLSETVVLPRETIIRHKSLRNGCSGPGGQQSWQPANVRGSRSYVARSNYF
ncbi:hypothetical protein ACHWQZ_G014516 [Mnemiopsis leidyi]